MARSIVSNALEAAGRFGARGRAAARGARTFDFLAGVRVRFGMDG